MATRDVGQLRTRLSFEDEGATQSLTRFRDDMRGLRSEMRTITSQGRDYSNSLKGLRQQSDVLSRQYRTQQERVRELNRRYQESVDVKGKDHRQTRNLATQYNNAVSEMNRMEGQLERVNEEIRRMESPWTRLGDQMETAGTKMQTVGRGMSDFGRTATMRVTTPILGVGAAALKVGMDFEEGMSRVQALSGATGDDMEALEEQAREFGETTRFSATESADAMGFLAMAGFEVNEIMDSMPGLLDLAASSGMDLGRTADITSNILSAFGMEADEAGRVADVLAKGASSANTNVEQLGGAMQYVAPVAASLGLEIEDMTAAVGLMSDAGIQGEQAGRQLRQGLLRLTDPTGAAADLIEELGINAFDADGSMKGLDEVVRELETGLEGMDDKTRAAALSTLFGAESVAGWTALIETGSDELSDYTNELENADGAASDIASTMQDNAKGSMVEFRSALEGAGIAIAEHLIPAFTDIVEKGTEVVRKFGELDEETQENIIKMGGLVAAVGPAALVLGNLTTVAGGFLRVGGRLVGMLGVAGAAGKGAGLLGAVSGLGMAGPVGLAVAGVAALAGGIYFLTRDTENLHDINYELINSVEEEITAIEDLEERFSELHRQNQLTSDEMLRYMDIMDELEKADSEKAIERLKDEQAELLEKSGFTNDEMEEFLRLNEQIVEETPNVTSAVSDQGNAYIDNLDVLRELNEEKVEGLLLDAQRELEKALENENQLLENQITLEEEIKETRDEINQTQHDRLSLMGELEIEERKQDEINQKILDKKNEMEHLDGDALETAKASLYILELEKAEQDAIVEAIGYEKEELDRVYDRLLDNLEEKNNSLDTTREELEEIDNMIGDYEQLILKSVGLNSERGDGLDLLDEEIRKIEQEQEELDKVNAKTAAGVEGYEEQNRKLQDQRQRLIDAQNELEEINRLAGETVYNKQVEIETRPSIDYLNRQLSSPLSRFIDLNVRGSGAPIPAYASGKDSHPGGPFVAGEKGWELGRLGNTWEILNAGLYERPRGYQVFTHDDSKRLLGAFNNLPTYATGTNMGAETNRIVNGLNNQTYESSEMVVLLAEQNNELKTSNELLTRLLGKDLDLYKLNRKVDEGLNNIGDRRQAAWGG